MGNYSNDIYSSMYMHYLFSSLFYIDVDGTVTAIKKTFHHLDDCYFFNIFMLSACELLRQIEIDHKHVHYHIHQQVFISTLYQFRNISYTIKLRMAMGNVSKRQPITRS